MLIRKVGNWVFLGLVAWVVLATLVSVLRAARHEALCGTTGTPSAPSAEHVAE